MTDVTSFMMMSCVTGCDWYRELECENSSNVSLGVEVVDIAGNTTLKNNLVVACKVSEIITVLPLISSKTLRNFTHLDL